MCSSDLEVVIALAEARKLRGRPQTALSTLRRLRRMSAGDPVVAADGCRREASIHVHASSYRAADHAVARGLDLIALENSERAAAIRADLLTTAAWSAYYDGNGTRGRVLADEAERAARSSGNLSTIADAVETGFIIGFDCDARKRAFAIGSFKPRARCFFNETTHGLLMRHSENGVIVAAHSRVRHIAGTARQNPMIRCRHMGMGANNERYTAVKITAHSLFLARGLAMKIDQNRIRHLA